MWDRYVRLTSKAGFNIPFIGEMAFLFIYICKVHFLNVCVLLSRVLHYGGFLTTDGVLDYLKHNVASSVTTSYIHNTVCLQHYKDD